LPVAEKPRKMTEKSMTNLVLLGVVMTSVGLKQESRVSRENPFGGRFKMSRK
jgi:hypothetical protein